MDLYSRSPKGPLQKDAADLERDLVLFDYQDSAGLERTMAG